MTNLTSSVCLPDDCFIKEILCLKNVCLTAGCLSSASVAACLTDLGSIQLIQIWIFLGSDNKYGNESLSGNILSEMYCWHCKHYSHALLLCLTDQLTEWCTFWPISSLAWLLHSYCVCVCDFVPAHVWFEGMIFGTDFLHVICLCIWVFTPECTHFCQVFVMWMFWLLNTCVCICIHFLKRGLWWVL